MSPGPVFFVELLTIGRRARYYFVRAAYGLFLLIIMGICYSTVFAHWREPTLHQQAEFANSFFQSYSWVQLFGILFLTPAMIAGTIAGEHERRTIDYLLTTSLSDIEITWGKFVARLAAIAAQLAAGIPILAIAMMLGGISPNQLLMSFTIALLTLLSLGGMSLSISARCRTSREAITRTYVILTALNVVPLLLWLLCEGYSREPTPSMIKSLAVHAIPSLQTVNMLNPVYYLGVVLFERGAPQVEFSTFAAVHLGAAAVFAVSAVWSLRRFYVKQAGRSATVKKQARRRGESLRMKHPMIWKDVLVGRGTVKMGFFGRIAELLLFLTAGGMLAWAYYESLDTHVGWRNNIETPIQIYGMVGVPLIASLALLLSASRAAGSITSEREQDTWLTLGSTPLEGREILNAKLFAALYQVRYWYLLIAVCWALCAAQNPSFLWVLPLIACVHLIILLFVSLVGLASSLVSKTSLRAIGTALAILVLGASIAPLFFAGITQSPSIFGFSLPVVLGGAHAFAVELFLEDRTFRGTQMEMFVISCLAVSGYAFSAWMIYLVLLNQFDEWAGRSSPDNFNQRTAPSKSPSNDATGLVAQGNDVEPEQAS